MMKIAVCDDEEIIASDIEKRLHKLSREMDVPIDVDVFFDGETLTDYVLGQKGRYDVIYLNIEMKKENGVDAARKIRLIDKSQL